MRDVGDFLEAVGQFNFGQFFAGALAKLIGLFLILAIGAGLFRVACVTFVDNYEKGYQYDKITGKVEILAKRGYIVNWPIVVAVHTVDLRPMQVCINANARVLNCKLVQFEPGEDGEALQLFVSWHGRDNYQGPGISNTRGGSTGTTALSEILKSYAYEGSGKTYPFLKVIRELKPEELAP